VLHQCANGSYLGSDEVVIGESRVARQERDFDWSISRDFGIDQIGHACGKAFGKRVELKVHTRR